MPNRIEITIMALAEAGYPHAHVTIDGNGKLGVLCATQNDVEYPPIPPNVAWRAMELADGT